jgi:predicted secreted acid phosphatase
MTSRLLLSPLMKKKYLKGLMMMMMEVTGNQSQRETKLDIIFNQQKLRQRALKANQHRINEIRHDQEDKKTKKKPKF